MHVYAYLKVDSSVFNKRFVAVRRKSYHERPSRSSFLITSLPYKFCLADASHEHERLIRERVLVNTLDS